jgi:glycosyltransferase involved in cell wall biosynthesis
MRIGIDIRPLQTSQRYQGVGYYALGLLKGLASLNLPWKFILFYDRSLPLHINIPGQLPAELVGIWRPRWEPRTREIWNQALSPIETRKYRLSLLHILAPEFVPFWVPVPRVVTIHDLLVFSKFTAVKTGLKYRLLYWSAAKADMVLTDSEATRQDFLGRYRSLFPRTKVTYLGVDRHFFTPIPGVEQEQIRERYRLTRTYILYLGDLSSLEHNARKNLPALLTAYADASRQVVERWCLVMAGKRGAYADYLEELAKKIGVRERVIFTDYVPDKDLPALLSGASIFAYPSLYEGFGLPALEAMAAGIPVLSSNRGSIPEVCGQAAVLVDPGNSEEMTNALFRLMTQPDLRRSLSTLGREQASRFSWEETARQTVEAYRLLL